MTARQPGGIGRPRSGGARATLQCGSALYFETASLAPGPDDLVPCVRHGYCTVHVVESLAATPPPPPPQRSRPRAPRRSHAELVAHLDTADAFTLSELRRARFSLRMITEAARERLLCIDEDAETVIVRPLRGLDADGAASRSPST